MALATCRCGQALEIPPQGSEHITCPRCSAKVRIIRKRRDGDPSASSSAAGHDGFLRFSCPCGRRLKVSAIERPSHGKCPDCGTIVPVPAGAGSSPSKSDSPTEELASADVAMLEAWTKGHLARGNGQGQGQGNGPTSTAEMPLSPLGRRAEAGFRVCPRCGKPIHLNADTCRACGTAVPKR
jgi:DNA-directed RNA polymerase subunit RPC12/RpoP